MNTENQKCEVVIFSDRAYQDIKNETYDKDPVETGGLLLGYVLEGGHWVVVEVIPPGNNSTHRYAYLEYDESLAKRVVDQIAGKYEQKLGLLGLWHRHPGSMDFFSGTDDGTNINFAELNPSYGAISGLVNIDPEFRMTMYHVDSPLNYTKVKTCVGDDIIPEELLKLKPGVTIEEIDAIKKTNTRQEHPSASQPSSSSQPQQATPHREEPRRTTQNREHHEKPQVIIQTPDTVTSIFKKLVLEHPKTFFALVVFVGLMGLYSIGSNKETEAEKQQNELRLAEEKTKQAEEERKKQEAEAKQAEEERRSKEEAVIAKTRTVVGKMSVGKTEVDGAVDSASVAKTIRGSSAAVKRCYDKALLANPTLKGKVSVTILINEKGRVESIDIAEDTLKDAETIKCIKGVISRLRFPKPEGGPASVKFPFMFSN